ncbi:MAG: hypothetical protein P8130_12925, partial [Deltaproteobacteria bacterium]
EDEQLVLIEKPLVFLGNAVIGIEYVLYNGNFHGFLILGNAELIWAELTKGGRWACCPTGGIDKMAADWIVPSLIYNFLAKVAIPLHVLSILTRGKMS